MQQIYVFSGLGADERVFGKLDLSGFELVHITWIIPRRHEYLESYVLRLAEHHRIPRKGAYVLGVSFGGICISQLAQYYDFAKIVLVSSAKTKNELPKLYTWTKFLPLDGPLSFLSRQKTNTTINWLFGVSDDGEKALLAAVIEDSDPEFTKWAMEEIRQWKNTQVPENCLHIHGDQDRIIPIHNVDYTIRIRGGGHFMIWTKAAEISFPIRNFLM